jgi:hypothetical protein
MGWRFTAEDRRVYLLMVNEEKPDPSGAHA